MKKLTIILLFGVLLVLTACGQTTRQRRDANEGAVVPYLDGGWVSVWNDEFDGDALDNTKWNYENGGNGWGNQELQFYRPQNTTVADGLLTITAAKESFQGREYTSSRLTTKYKGDWTYGRIQIRAKLPAGRGTWPAIWMMPTQSTYGGWPHSGEIDIVEHVGYDMNRIHTNLHTSKYNHNQGNNVGASKTVANVATEFHLYEMIWDPGQIRIFVNGEPLNAIPFGYSAAFNQDVEYNRAWPFDQQFFLILNIAVGGTWGGAQGVDDLIFPQTMQVDYVRVYQRDYFYNDAFDPTKVENLRLSNTLANSIWWNQSTDDISVSHYEIFVDGVLHKTSRMNQTMLTALSAGTYEVTVRAVDFVGNTSEFSEPLTFTKP